MATKSSNLGTGVLQALVLATTLLVSSGEGQPTATPSPVPGHPSLGVPMPQSNTAGPPVELDECQLTYTGLLIGKVSGFIAKFTNDTSTTADVVEIQVNDTSGNPLGIIRDVGSFAPGVEVTHKYHEGEGTITFPLFSHTHVACSIAVVHFVDGTVWRAQSQPAGTYSHEATPKPKSSPNR